MGCDLCKDIPNDLTLFTSKIVDLERVDEIKTLSDLVKKVFSDEDILYELEHKGLSFSHEEILRIYEVVSKIDNSYIEDNFYRYCFSNTEELNEFIEENVEIYLNKVKNNNVPYILKRIQFLLLLLCFHL